MSRNQATAVDGIRWPGKAASLLGLAGARYWSASLLPALVGTTLPLWLRPPGFTPRLPGALEFFLATLLLHAGFSLLHARFEHRSDGRCPKTAVLIAATACALSAAGLGWHLTRSVPGLIFPVYGLAVLFSGLLYVAPPARFSRRAGGEIVLSIPLAFLPVLGAYLVQTGDLTRPVYVAALPIYAATLLWACAEQAALPRPQGDASRGALLTALGPRVPGRVVVLGVFLLAGASLAVAVLSSSVPPVASVALLLYLPVRKTIRAWRRGGGDPAGIRALRTAAWGLHTGLCLVLAASSLWASGHRLPRAFGKAQAARAPARIQAAESSHFIAVGSGAPSYRRTGPHLPELRRIRASRHKLASTPSSGVGTRSRSSAPTSAAAYRTFQLCSQPCS